MVPDEQRLRGISDFIATLTLVRVALGLGMAAGVVVLYALWESRQSWASLVWQSPTLLGVISVGGILIAVGAAINSLQQRLDARTDSLYQQMRDQIVDMQNSIKQNDKQNSDDRREMQRQINDLTMAEQRCQLRVQLLQQELEAIGRRTS